MILKGLFQPYGCCDSNNIIHVKNKANKIINPNDHLEIPVQTLYRTPLQVSADPCIGPTGKKTHVFYGTAQAAVCNTTLRQQSLQTPNFIS